MRRLLAHLAFLVPSKRNYPQRCVVVFATANQGLRMEVGEIIAKHAAEGRLQSGATIRAAIRAFESHNLTAITALQQEFGNLIQSRGREWKRAMSAVDQAIEGQIRAARHLLERPFRIANGSPGYPAPSGASIDTAIDDELRGVAKRLLEQHAAFSEGWTAPVGKQWRERHPIIFGALAAVGGAILTAAIALLSAHK